MLAGESAYTSDDDVSALAVMVASPDPAKLRELRGRLETGKAMFAPLDARRVGAAAHKRAARELDELESALTNLLGAK
ncbi:MAG: hypothetical protein AAB074_13620 [Planctomycetota bacterium]